MDKIKGLETDNTHWKVDSLRLKIPFDLCTNIVPECLGKIITYSETSGEIISEKKDMFRFEKNGINIYAQVENRYNVNLKGFETHLIILLSAKILKQKYFSGINKNSINEVYNNLISYGIAQFSFETFINSKVFDVDICRDLSVNESDFRQLMKTFKTVAIPHISLNAGIKVFDKKKNLGCEFGIRNYTSDSYAYMKYYFKTFELQTKSELFKFNYLNDMEIDNIGRCEITLRNKKMFNSLLGKNADFSLANVLDLENDDITKFAKKIHEYYLQMYKSIDGKKEAKETKNSIDFVLAFIAAKVKSKSEFTELQKIIEAENMYKYLVTAGMSRSQASKLKKRLIVQLKEDILIIQSSTIELFLK